MKDIIRCSASEVDLNAAKMEQDVGFRTDAQISSSNKMNGERTLERWVPDDHENDVSLDLDGAGESNGWKAEDMFKANEAYGVTSTFKDNLEGYTLQISTDKDSDLYR